MEKLEFKDTVIVWSNGKKYWVINYNDLTNAYITGKHPYLKTDISTAIKNKIINHLKIIFGEWYFSRLKKIKNYTKLTATSIKNISLTNKKLGSGRYANVYLYKDYAIKIITHNQSKLINGSIEAKTLKLLMKDITLEYLSPNIINIYDYIHEKNKDYIVMEKLDQTLWSFLSNKPSERKITGIILQVLFTLCILQYKYPGFRHNDLKADNILLDLKSKKKNIYLKIKNMCWIIPPDIPLVKIADFDYVNIPNKINNDKVKTDHSKTFGCTPEKSKIYDLHIFMNSIYTYKKSLPTSLLQWIQKYLPEPTRGSETKYIKYGRLKDPKYWEEKIKSPFYLLQTSIFDEFKSNKCNAGIGVWGI
jgi:serine/threonine protein kinase